MWSIYSHPKTDIFCESQRYLCVYNSDCIQDPAHARHATLSPPPEISKHWSRRNNRAKYGIVVWRPIHRIRYITQFTWIKDHNSVIACYTHNCSEMHRIVPIPIIAHYSRQTSGTEFVKFGIGYVFEFNTLGRYGINVINILRFDNRDRFSKFMGSIGNRPNNVYYINKQPCGWHLTYDSSLSLDIGYDTNTTFVLLRLQKTYMT